MEKREPFIIVRGDEFPIDTGWRLVRRALGVNSFGINFVDIEPGKSIPEHDETERDQEEVYIAWRGDATIVINGEEHPLPEGAFVRFDPEPKRYVLNKGNATIRVLCISAPQRSGYTPLDWA